MSDQLCEEHFDHETEWDRAAQLLCAARTCSALMVLLRAQAQQTALFTAWPTGSKYHRHICKRSLGTRVWCRKSVPKSPAHFSLHNHFSSFSLSVSALDSSWPAWDSVESVQRERHQGLWVTKLTKVSHFVWNQLNKILKTEIKLRYWRLEAGLWQQCLGHTWTFGHASIQNFWSSYKLKVDYQGTVLLKSLHRLSFRFRSGLSQGYNRMLSILFCKCLCSGNIRYPSTFRFQQGFFFHKSLCYVPSITSVNLHSREIFKKRKKNQNKKNPHTYTHTHCLLGILKWWC